MALFVGTGGHMTDSDFVNFPSSPKAGHANSTGAFDGPIRALMEVLVVAPEECWEQKFSREARIIRQALGPIATEIHHIGSTSVPGIYAKPIIDILVEATSIDAVDDSSAALTRRGYEAMGEFGISGRRYFRKNSQAGIRKFHVHVFACGSPAVERHLAFRGAGVSGRRAGVFRT